MNNETQWGSAVFVTWHVINGAEVGKESAANEIGQLIGDGYQVASMTMHPETDYDKGRCVVLLISAVHTTN